MQLSAFGTMEIFLFIGVKSCQYPSSVFQCAVFFLSAADKVDEVPPSQKNTRDNSSADMRVATIKPRPSSRCLVTPTDFNVILRLATLFKSASTHSLHLIHYIGHISTITMHVSQITYSSHYIDHTELPPLQMPHH